MKIKTRQELEAKKSGVRSFFKDTEKADLNLCRNRMCCRRFFKHLCKIAGNFKRTRHQMFSGIGKRTA